MAIPNALPEPTAGEQPPGGNGEAGNFVEDLLTAIGFIVIGLGAFMIALDYRTGTLHRMGPGIFPRLVAGLMVVIGGALAIQSFVSWKSRRVVSATPALAPNVATLRALFFVMLSLLAFAVLVRPAGLFIATTVLTFIATRAEPGRGLVGSLLLAVALSSIAAAIFVYGIGLPIPLWP